MLMKAIKSVFNFYILYVQPFIGLALVGYGAWEFSGDSICTADKVIACNTSVLLKPASYFVVGTVVLFVWYIAWQKERSKEEEFKSSIKPEDFVK
ncbi:hypothetical protein BZ329_21870 [Salmonella enterica subsp. enterica serovar Enteritidis]|uniref:hypothetical protein n=1 Tax=Escherichia coli TaxID=562 RepID=UPI0005CD21A0|nr:hypothetical protein [Escherichia coli]ECS4582053.1 hypothetical protein [Salmonella enterica subsp. enterica serovar Typhimurium var. 5-]EDF0482792.1 hypothetical protein [Salmonella enterica subsp. enterica serovar Enteritidis]EDG9825703.1 hypothetical protein [Salmonella enterica subsp. enterica serovar Typhimurium]EEV4145408.1 hypothetical protein [Escherichia coli]EFB2874281.1 hypothetical protein [Escherichia coli]